MISKTVKILDIKEPEKEKQPYKIRIEGGDILITWDMILADKIKENLAEKKNLANIKLEIKKSDKYTNYIIHEIEFIASPKQETLSETKDDIYFENTEKAVLDTIRILEKYNSKFKELNLNSTELAKVILGTIGIQRNKDSMGKKFNYYTK